jgi:hypothetical protein
MRYDEVNDDFNTTMLGEAMGNGSVDESLATVNLLTILDENLGGPGFLLGSVLQLSRGKMRHDGENKGERKQVTISDYLVDGMRIIRMRMFVCPYTPISPNSPGYSPPYDRIYSIPYIPRNSVCTRVCTCICTCVCTCKCTYIYMNIYIYIYIYIYICIYI